MLKKSLPVFVLLMMFAATSRAMADIPLPTAYAGAFCTFGQSHSGVIGGPIGAKDIPGPRGDEISQIYGVFYAAQKNNVEKDGFAGWLYAAFDGTYAFGGNMGQNECYSGGAWNGQSSNAA